MIKYKMIDNETDFEAGYDKMHKKMHRIFPGFVKSSKEVGSTIMFVASIDDTRIDISYRTSGTSVIIHEKGVDVKNKLEKELNVSLKLKELK